MPSYQYKDSHVKDKTVSPTVLSLTWESIPGKDGFYIETGPRWSDHYRYHITELKGRKMISYSIITIVSSTGSSGSSSSSSSSGGSSSGSNSVLLLLLLLSLSLSLSLYFHCYTCHYYYSRVPLYRGSVQHNITYNTLRQNINRNLYLQHLTG